MSSQYSSLHSSGKRFRGGRFIAGILPNCPHFSIRVPFELSTNSAYILQPEQLRVVHVEDGKRGKSRDVPILMEFAVMALHAWKTAQETAHHNTDESGKPRDFVFCSVGKGDKLLADKSTHTDTVWRVVKKTGAMAGIDWSPHDGRRTVITETAESAGIKSAQQIAGHSDVSTTLGYVGTIDAKALKNRVQLRYGALTKHDRQMLTTEPLPADSGD